MSFHRQYKSDPYLYSKSHIFSQLELITLDSQLPVGANNDFRSGRDHCSCCCGSGGRRRSRRFSSPSSAPAAIGHWSNVGAKQSVMLFWWTKWSQLYSNSHICGWYDIFGEKISFCPKKLFHAPNDHQFLCFFRGKLLFFGS